MNEQEKIPLCSDCGKRPAVIDGSCIYCRAASYRMDKEPIQQALKETIDILKSVQGGCCYQALVEIRLAREALKRASRMEQCL